MVYHGIQPWYKTIWSAERNPLKISSSKCTETSLCPILFRIGGHYMDGYFDMCDSDMGFFVGGRYFQVY